MNPTVPLDDTQNGTVRLSRKQTIGVNATKAESSFHQQLTDETTADLLTVSQHDALSADGLDSLTAFIAERFRALGCAEVQVRLIHRDQGPASFRADDCIVLDLSFASHANTAKVRVKGEAAGACMFQTKHGPSRLAQEAARAWARSGWPR